MEFHMKINGLQKTTLLDYPGKVACTIFTAGCNFRCPFCHNASLVTQIDPAAQYSEEELFTFLKKRRGLLDGVCITGGEPLLQPDIKEFIQKIKALGYLVKLDTNGSFPEKLQELIEEGLVDYVAMDIKNCWEKYEQTIGVHNMAGVRTSVDFLLQGNVEYEFRTTVVAELHTIQDIEKIAEYICTAPRYFLQNFVDSGDLIGENMHAVSPAELRQMQKAASKYLSNVNIRGI